MDLPFVIHEIVYGFNIAPFEIILLSRKRGISPAKSPFITNHSENLRRGCVTRRGQRACYKFGYELVLSATPTIGSP
jgi:hypothetical protein